MYRSDSMLLLLRPRVSLVIGTELLLEGPFNVSAVTVSFFGHGYSVIVNTIL